MIQYFDITQYIKSIIQDLQYKTDCITMSENIHDDIIRYWGQNQVFNTPLLLMNLENFIFCRLFTDFMCITHLQRLFLHLFLDDYRIFSITTQALIKIEELFEIQCCYLTSKKEFSTLFSSG